MDALSRIVDLITVESVVSTRLEAGGDWALAFPGAPHVKLVAIHRGVVWIRVGGEERRLEPGDCFVLASGGPYAVASAPGAVATDGLPAFQASPDGVVRLGTADEVVMTGARLVLDEGSAALLLDALPPLFVARDDPALRAGLELFAHETAAPRPGSDLVAARLGQVLFVQALRAALDADDRVLRGWLAGLHDERVGAALQRMHADPARRWTVPELAASVHLSRSGFADRFRALVGVPPLQHLLWLRMHVAARALREGRDPVKQVGAAAGYASEAAFSTAFKRVMGVSPTAWRRAAS